MTDEHDARDELLPRELLDMWTVPEMPADLEERVMTQARDMWTLPARGAERIDAATVRRANTALAVFAAAAAAAALVLSLRQPDVAPSVASVDPPPPIVVAADAPSAAATVVGDGLDENEIREVVAAHIGEVTACYEAGLLRDPSLRGKVMLAFTIGPKGAVTDSRVHESTVGDPYVGKCIAKVATRWDFPAPHGGKSVAVMYPFQLEPG